MKFLKIDAANYIPVSNIIQVRMSHGSVEIFFQKIEVNALKIDSRKIVGTSEWKQFLTSQAMFADISGSKLVIEK